MTLTVDRLETGYGSHRVLHDVSLTLPEGRLVAVLGANGAGKTTLLRACAGLLPLWSGSRRVDGEDASRRRPNELRARGVCLVPEGRAVFPSLTVEENLRVMGLSAEATEQAVRTFPVLGRRFRQRAGTMSGGEQQMLALARTFSLDSKYVLLDEVSMGLAPVIVDEIFEFIGGLARRGVGLLLVEQYIARALAFADLVYVLQRGRVAFAGERGEVDVEELTRTYLGGGSDDRGETEATLDEG